jgi:4-hydroxy-2-oxoheptanedioate aldolase
MQPAADLKLRLAKNELTLGVLITDHLWPRLIEICKQAGLHYAIVDQEHGPHSDEAVAHACQIARLADFPLIVRCVSTDFTVVRRAIDMGPSGLMFPCVDTTQQLDVVRDAIRMPPRGKRRPGGPGNHWLDNYQYETWRREVEEHFVVLPQIESRIGLKNAVEIAGHEIVTALAVGPYDLAADLGCCWNPEAAIFRDAVAQLRAAAEVANKPFWMIGNADLLVKDGFRFVCVGEPSYILAGAIRAQVERLKGD